MLAVAVTVLPVLHLLLHYRDEPLGLQQEATGA
jgi:hypothetical protein